MEDEQIIYCDECNQPMSMHRYKRVGDKITPMSCPTSERSMIRRAEMDFYDN